MADSGLQSPAATPGESPGTSGHGFGTAPVFLASVSTILGAVLFLRFGYAVGHVGALGTLLIILIGHAVTLPTALAIAEIATNRRVEGGGEYFIISRYPSQAISVAFYKGTVLSTRGQSSCCNFCDDYTWFRSISSFGCGSRYTCPAR